MAGKVEVIFVEDKLPGVKGFACDVPSNPAVHTCQRHGRSYPAALAEGRNGRWKKLLKGGPISTLTNSAYDLTPRPHTCQRCLGMASASAERIGC